MKEKELLLNKSYCELIITSKDITPEMISHELDILPSRKYVKGAEFSSLHSVREGKRFQNLWAIKSETTISEEQGIASHISFFKTFLGSKLVILNRYKSDSRFELTFWIWVETENAGLGIELTEQESLFLNSISNSICFTFLTKSSIELSVDFDLKP